MKSSSKAAILAIDLDQNSSDNDSIQHSSPIKVCKFDSSTLTKGLFVVDSDEIDYQPLIKQELKPISHTHQPIVIKSHTSISMLREIQYDSDSEHQIQSHINPNCSQEPTNKENETKAIHTQDIKQLNRHFEQNSEEAGKTSKGESENSSEEEEEVHSKQTQNRTVIDFKQICKHPDSERQDIREFVALQIQLGKVISGSIYRDQSGFNILWPQFSLMLNQNGKKVLNSKKMMGSSTANYYISTESGVQKIEDPRFLGKLRSNSVSNVYHVFDNGFSLKESGKLNKKIRTIQATLKFKSQTNVLEPRQFEVFCLKSNAKYWQLQGVRPDQEIGLDVLIQYQGNNQAISVFRNRKPTYSQVIKGFTLNFGGRVLQASIKNFILQDQSTGQEVMMMGKTTEDIFRVDITYPLKPYIGFAIGLANFDSKFLSD